MIRFVMACLLTVILVCMHEYYIAIAWILVCAMYATL